MKCEVKLWIGVWYDGVDLEDVPYSIIDRKIPFINPFPESRYFVEASKLNIKLLRNLMTSRQKHMSKS